MYRKISIVVLFTVSLMSVFATQKIGENKTLGDSNSESSKGETNKTQLKTSLDLIIILPTSTQSSVSSTTTTTAATTTTTAKSTTPCTCGKGAKPSTFRSLKDDNEYSDASNFTKIVNGTASKTHAWPWAAALVNITATPKSAVCGGTLISHQYVLTAAHCVVGTGLSSAKVLKNFRVYLGSNKIHGNGSHPVVVPISSFRVHPKHSIISGTTVSNYDFALLRLATPVTFNSSISPICLSQTGKPFTGKSVTAVGWGYEFYQQNKTSNVIREVALRVISNSACNNTQGIITPEMICTGPRANGNNKKGTCQGDSGSGLYYKKPTAGTYTLIGVTSFGTQCQRQGDPSVFARVSRVIDFIKGSTMNTTFCTNTFFP